MKKLHSTIIEVLVKKFKQDRKTYREIQSLVEVEGFKRPSLGFISKVLGSKRKSFKKIV